MPTPRSVRRPKKQRRVEKMSKLLAFLRSEEASAEDYAVSLLAKVARLALTWASRIS